ncbi:GNAT family N-acetyltransferase [Kribbella sp. NPDC005582]|uniref:GNAT family N-acetyltransferase n=1 Tax=Kribbella sp. NPDC005582 TaxID=3156893 RepID=UPI0033BE1F7A
MPINYSWHFHKDPAVFLSDAAPYLAAHPVEANVIAVGAQRSIGRGVLAQGDHWLALARDGVGEVVGAAIRIWPVEPRPVFLAPTPPEAAVELARVLHRRGEHPGGANGALPAARACAEEAARLWGGTVVEAMASRVWELGSLKPPRGVAGRLRPAGPDDAELCLAWFNDFDSAARQQTGRTQNGAAGTGHSLQEMLDRIADGRVSLWENDDSLVVHLTGINWPAFGVGRIGPVYTPTEHRGHGYAAAAVAAASQLVIDQGGRVCLYTDTDNPVSNRIYARIGFEPLGVAADHLINDGEPSVESL